MMKRILVIIAMFFCLHAQAQGPWTQKAARGNANFLDSLLGYMKVMKDLYVVGDVYFNNLTADSNKYVFVGTDKKLYQKTITGGSGTVDSNIYATVKRLNDSIAKCLMKRDSNSYVTITRLRDSVLSLQTWVNAQGFLKTYTETDPVWAAEKSSYYTKTQSDARYLQSYTVDSALFVTVSRLNDSINKCLKKRDSTLYVTVTRLRDSVLALKTWVGAQGYLTSYTETDPVWNAQKSSYLTSAVAATTYASLSGSYTNPSWITSLAWSKITSTPTTIAGYGITDATSTARAAISSSATGLTYTPGTGVFSLTSGYSIPTTANQTDWTTAYTNRITSLTTTGSGAATLTSNTLNIPTPTLAGLGGIPYGDTVNKIPTDYQLDTAKNNIRTAIAGYVSLSGSYSNPSWITSLAWSKITGTPTTIAGYGITDYNSLWDTRLGTKTTDNLTEGSTNKYFSNSLARSAISSTATGLTYTSGTGVFSLTSGYIIPTTTEQTNWTSAYTNRITSLTTTGSSGAATLISNTLNIPNYTLSGLGGIPYPDTSTKIPSTYQVDTGKNNIRVSLAAKLDTGTNSYVKNTTTQQTASYNISGSGNIGAPTSQLKAYFWGNSITKGTAISGSSADSVYRYPTLVCKRLGLQEINNAISSSSLMWETPTSGLAAPAMINNLASIPTYNNTIAFGLIEYGINDIRQNYPAWDSATFRARYNTILDTFIARGWSGKIIIATTTYCPACTTARQAQFNYVISSIASQRNIPLWDAYSITYNTPFNYIWSDNIHINKDGNVAMADRLTRLISNTVYSTGNKLAVSGITMLDTLKLAVKDTMPSFHYDLGLDSNGYVRASANANIRNNYEIAAQQARINIQGKINVNKAPTSTDLEAIIARSGKFGFLRVDSGLHGVIPTGKSLEMQYVGDAGHIFAYDRDATTSKTLYLNEQTGTVIISKSSDNGHGAKLQAGVTDLKRLRVGDDTEDDDYSSGKGLQVRYTSGELGLIYARNSSTGNKNISIQYSPLGDKLLIGDIVDNGSGRKVQITGTTGGTDSIYSAVALRAPKVLVDNPPLNTTPADSIAVWNRTTKNIEWAKKADTVVWAVAVSDLTTALTTGTNKAYFRMPYAATLVKVKASVLTVSSSGTPTFDINEEGTSVLGTKLSIDASEKTSETAASAATITDSALARDAEIEIDIDTAGTSTAGAVVYLYWIKA